MSNPVQGFKVNYQSPHQLSPSKQATYSPAKNPSNYSSNFNTVNTGTTATRSSSPFQRIPSYNIENDLYEIKKSLEDETQEVQKRYQGLYERHLKLGRHCQELEKALEEERNKQIGFENNYNAMYRDLEQEKKLRAGFEHENASLREELRKRDLAYGELEKQFNKLQQANAYFANENNTLRGELAKISEFYRVKQQEAEANYQAQLRDFKARNDSLLNELELQKVNFNNHLNQLDQEWKEKLRRLEDQLRQREANLSEMSRQCQHLADENEKLRNNFQEAVQKEIIIVRKEEENKANHIIEDLKAQMAKTLADERFYWENKMQEAEREINNRGKQINDMKLHHDAELVNLHNELERFNAQNANLALEADRLRKEAISKDNALKKYEAENQDLRREYQRLKDGREIELSKLKQDYANQLRLVEEDKRRIEQILMDKDQQLKATQDQLAKFKIAFGSLKDVLVGNINKAISESLVPDIYK